MANPPVRPLITTAPLSEFGELPNSAEFLDPSQMGRDLTYVPGFSEMRRDRDLAVGAYHRGEITAAEVPTLPVNMRWARCQNRKGESDNLKTFAHGRNGYVAVTKENVGQDWLKEAPGGAQWQADGTLRNGDTILMWCPKEQAARNQMRKQRATQARVEAATESFSRTLVNQGTPVPKGAEPFVQKEPKAAEAPVPTAPKK